MKLNWAGNQQGKIRVLVTGVGGNVGQGILKALSACKLASWVVGTDCLPGAVGLFGVDRGYVVPKASDPSFPSRLVQIVCEEKIDIVLVGADAETIHLSQHKEVIEAQTGACVLVAPARAVESAHDKWATAAWCLEKGIPHPKTVLASNAEAVKRLAEEIGLPLIVKPRHGFASRDVVTATQMSELFAAAAKLGEQGIVQEYIGDDHEEFTATVLCDSAGHVRALLVMQRELLQGTSYRVSPCLNEAYIANVRSWGEAFGAQGPINFQFRLRQGHPVCFEINARFSGTVGLRYHFGYNDVEMALRLFALKEEIAQPQIHPGSVLRFWEELFLPDTGMSELQSLKRTEEGRIMPSEA
ncbi:MAG: ATP-grasp domain-containing protein [Alphaproteobacteria bacterium]|nr:ATP-grasp domain-containing protein [Alphaproteobacteria bacterium]